MPRKTTSEIKRDSFSALSAENVSSIKRPRKLLTIRVEGFLIAWVSMSG
jgi:hypothetical protein